jgi:hypothetical protein
VVGATVFSNLPMALALTIVWPLVLLGVLAGCEWLERRTLLPEEVVPRRLRRMADQPPEALEAIVLEETAQVVAEYWSATGRSLDATATAVDGQPVPRAAPARRSGRHARRWVPSGGRGRHERR